MVANFASTLSAERINVNCVRPGWILTEGESAFCAEDEIRRMADEALPLGIGSPADVAAAVAFLTSDAANYITGITLPVDGGFGVAQRIPGMHQPIPRASQRCPLAAMRAFLQTPFFFLFLSSSLPFLFFFPSFVFL